MIDVMIGVRNSGFTLIELIVAISVVAILSAVVLANMNDGRAQARDAERQADLRTLQSALELYRQAHGRYPAGCNGALTWSGQLDTDYECSDGSAEYIRGHTAGVTFAPGFIPALPTDPKLNGDDSGYVYTTNAAGTVYKMLARNTVETENIGWYHPFRSCDITFNNTGLCDQVASPAGSFNSMAPDSSACYEPPAGMGGVDNDVSMANKDTQYDSSYGIWGGFATPAQPPSDPNYDDYVERETEDVICDMI